MPNYRMVGSDQFQASRKVREALAGRSAAEAEALIARVIDAAYRSEQDMAKLREILDGSRQ